MNPSSLYTIMCTQLLEHDKVIQNDQRAQTILVYLFLSYHCITFIFFFQYKRMENILLCIGFYKED